MIAYLFVPLRDDDISSSVTFHEMKKKAKSYSWIELEDARLNSGDFHLTRFHEMFDEIDTKIKEGKPINNAEAENYCEGLWIAEQNNRGNFKMRNEPCCKDYWFKYAYRHYWSDLHGIYTHTNPFTKKKIPKKEIQTDIEFLKSEAELWQEDIDKLNHKEQLLNLIAKETRNEIKDYNKDPQWHFHGFFNESRLYDHGLLIIRLRSKYIYLRVRDYYDKLGTDKQIVNFKGEQIEYNADSLIHILNRHYEISRKQANREKSLHDEDVHPDEIFDIINGLLLLLCSETQEKIDSNKIYFIYNEKPYTIWIKKATRFVKGIGKQEYKFISTFYPVEHEDELGKLNDYKEHKLNEQYSIYIKNTEGNKV